MLKSVHFENFVVFKHAENIVFGNQCPNIFIGENGSGKSAVFEGIRRCLKAKLNTSVSKPCDPKLVSYFMCRFKIDEQSDIISGIVSIPISQAAQVYDPTGTMYKSLETDTNDSMNYFKFVIEYEDKENVGFHVDLLHLICTVKGETEIDVHETTQRVSKGNILNDLYMVILKSKEIKDNTIGSKLLNIFNYEQLEICLVPTEFIECQELLTNLSAKVVFTFPLRSIGPLQWSKSNRIVAEAKEENYKEAVQRCEIIKTFLSQEEQFVKDKETRIFDNITNMSEQYTFCLNKDNGDILVQDERFKLLKTPEGILEAKYVAILLSGKQYQTILLEEPDRGMHPQFVQRMVQVIQHVAETNRKIVVLITHNTTFLTPWTLPSCFRFSRGEQTCTVKCIGDIVGTNLKTLRLMTNDKISDIVFAKRVLFCKGDSDKLFFNEMANFLVSTREPDINPIYATNAFLSKYKEKLQNVLSDLTIVKMNGDGNVEACRNICTNMSLPKKFVVDQDIIKLR